MSNLVVIGKLFKLQNYIFIKKIFIFQYIYTLIINIQYTFHTTTYYDKVKLHIIVHKTELFIDYEEL